MASLNLQPNLAVIAVQTGLFFANFVVLKKLLINPYLEVREKRRHVTTGNLDSAASLVEANRASQQAISARMNQTFDDLKTQRESAKKRAAQERDAILGKADGEAKKVIQESQNTIRASLDEERAKVPAIVATLADQLFNKVLN